MTTDISVTTTNYQYEKRGWLWGPHGTEAGTNPSGTLDLTTFTAGTHYPNGYVPSGLVLGRITTGGKLGLYDSTATDGRQTAVGLLFASIKVPASTATPVGCAFVVHGFVDPARLPIPAQVTTAVRTALPLIHFGS